MTTLSHDHAPPPPTIHLHHTKLEKYQQHIEQIVQYSLYLQQLTQEIPTSSQIPDIPIQLPVFKETMSTLMKAYHEIEQGIRLLQPLNDELEERDDLDGIDELKSTPESLENLAIDVEEQSFEQESDDDEEEEVEIQVQNIQPVFGEEAQELNRDVIRRIEVALNHDIELVQDFKNQAMSFGKGELDGQDFYDYLRSKMTSEILETIVLDFARLLAIDTLRISLLQAHALAIRPSPQKQPDAKMESDEESIPEKKNLFPAELEIEPINHLMFVIHGIGQHVDFQDGEYKSWDGTSGLEGGNHTFREIFREMLSSQFKDIPISLELQSVEWHEELHAPTGVDNVFDMVCPDGASGLREFSKSTLMDVLYYVSPGYGQFVVNTVTEQLNAKYAVFIQEHPGWNGKISIFAHSLGSVIAYDILTNEPDTVGRTGIRFPKLDFEVENFFAAGSPVPVMILSRGELNIQDGNIQQGMQLPRANHYFNIFHPIDAIAYRVEPLIKPEMRGTPAVELIPASRMKDCGFVKLHQMWEKITTPIHGVARIDHVMRRRKREGMMEMAYAFASHSAYWESEDVVQFVLMQICRPVIQTLRLYTHSDRPLPVLKRRKVKISATNPSLINGNGVVRETCTGFWHEKMLLLDKKWLHVFSGADAISVRKRGSIPLTKSTQAHYGDDPFCLRLCIGEIEYILKAQTTDLRNSWISAINEACLNIRPGAIPLRRYSSTVSLPTDYSLDYFGALKAGSLSKKGESTWLDVWKTRWFVLHGDRIDYFENAPALTPTKQYYFADCTVYCIREGFYFRVLSSTGAAVEMRVQDRKAFHQWLDAFGQVEGMEIVRTEELVKNSPSAVVIVANKKPSSSSTGRNSPKQNVRIQGHQILRDDKNNQYAAYVVKIESSGTSIVVCRRFTEFRKLHAKLRQIFPHDQIPPLPHTRLWNKFDPLYLKQKSVHLQGYLSKIVTLCTDNRGAAVLQEFLTDESNPNTPPLN